MRTKLLTLACGLACGFGIAFAVQAAAGRSASDRQGSRHEITGDRRFPAGSYPRESVDHRDNDDDDQDDDRGDMLEGDDHGRPPRREEARDAGRHNRMELAARDPHDPRNHARRDEDQERPEFRGPRGRRDFNERRPDVDERRGGERRGSDDRHPEMGGPRGRRDFGDRGSHGRNDFEERGPRGREEEHQRHEFGGPYHRHGSADHGPGGGAPRHHHELDGHRFAGHGPDRFDGHHPWHNGHQSNRDSRFGHSHFGPRPCHCECHCERDGHRFAGHGPGRFEGPHPGHHGPRFGDHQFGGRGHFGPHEGHFAHHHGGPRPHWGIAGDVSNGSPFRRLDVDADGKITKDEVMQMFAKVDTNGDGAVTREELVQAIMSAHASDSAAEKKSDVAPQRAHDGHDSERPHGNGVHHPGGPPPGWGRGGRGQRGGGFGPFGPGHRGMGGPGPHGPPSADILLERFDKAHKGSLSKADVPEFVWNQISKADADGDGTVSKGELEAHFKQPGSGSPTRGDKSIPPNDKHEDGKPDDDKPQALNLEIHKPVDATTAVNVAS